MSNSENPLLGVQYEIKGLLLLSNSEKSLLGEGHSFNFVVFCISVVHLQLFIISLIQYISILILPDQFL